MSSYLVLLLGCRAGDPGDFKGATLKRAWIEEYFWFDGGVIGGVFTASGVLGAETIEGTVLHQEIELIGGSAGCCLQAIAASFDVVPFVFPHESMPAEALFDPYTGTLETATYLAGYQSLHLRNENGIELDKEGLSLIFGFTISAVWAKLKTVPDPPLFQDSDSWNGFHSGDSTPDDSNSHSGDSTPDDSNSHSGDSTPDDSNSHSGDSTPN